MAINVASEFAMQAQLPLDARSVVADLTARDAIPSGIRFQGLQCFVLADETTYVLKTGIANGDWIALGSGGGILTVADITARNAVDAADRYDGLLAYVVGVGEFYQLRGGILDANWVLLSIGVTSSIPVGVMVPFAGTVVAVPQGFLPCDGAPISRALYASLFTAIGTAWGDGSTNSDGSASGFSGTHFNVPDTRGMFLRGTSNFSTADPDRTSRTALKTGGNTGNNVGSYQGSALESHNHQQFTSLANAGSTMSVGATNRGSSSASAESTGSTGGNETRPKNVYVNHIIRASAVAASAPLEGSYGTVVPFSSNTTATGRGIFLGDATSGSITLTLPTAASMINKVIIVKKIDSSVNTVTLDGSGSETIDGALTYVLTDEDYSIKIVSDGTAWFII